MIKEEIEKLLTAYINQKEILEEYETFYNLYPSKDLKALGKGIKKKMKDIEIDLTILLLKDLGCYFESAEQNHTSLREYSSSISTTPCCSTQAKIFGGDNLFELVAKFFSYKRIQKPKFEFVSYTGEWPNLCSGTMTFKVDGKEYKIERLESTGGLDKDYEPYIGKWKIKKDKLPEELKPFLKDIEKLANDNIELGCCGGCA